MDDTGRERLKVLVDAYKEFRSESRHQEIQRAAVSPACVAFASVLIGYALKNATRAARPYVGVFAVNFSILSILLLRKYYERFELSRNRSIIFMKSLETELDMGEECVSLIQIWSAARRITQERHPYMSFVRLHKLWEAMLWGTTSIGLSLTIWGQSEWLQALLPKHKMDAPNPAIGTNAPIILLIVTLIAQLVFLVVHLLLQMKRSNLASDLTEIENCRKEQFTEKIRNKSVAQNASLVETAKKSLKNFLSLIYCPFEQ